MTGPMSASTMELHSICHPGRPGPQGESQDGSPGLDAFHSAKSAALRFRGSTCTRIPAWLSSCLNGNKLLITTSCCRLLWSRCGPPACLLAARQSTIARKGLHVKKDITAVDGVAVTVVDDALDGRHHILHVLGGAGLRRWPCTAQCVHVIVKLINVTRCQLQGVLLLFRSPVYLWLVKPALIHHIMRPRCVSTRNSAMSRSLDTRTAQ